MKKFLKYAICAAVVLTAAASYAQTAGDGSTSEPAAGAGADSLAADIAVQADSTAAPQPASDDLQEVTADGVTASDGGMRLKKRFLPTARRIDREIRKHKYVFKGETMIGLTASYGTISSQDADMFPVFENISIDGSVASVDPFIGYFYCDNNCVGVRLGYTRLKGRVDTFGVNLGEQNDIDIEIPWIDLSSDRFSVGLFHRSYVALDERARFGVFAEAEVSFSTGENLFAYKSGDRLKYTSSDNMKLRVLFSPGVAVYAFPNVCMSLSFGLGGFTYTAIRQYDENGVKTGSRDYSKLNFRLNLADIRFGMTVHLWNKKRDRKVQ